MLIKVESNGGSEREKEEGYRMDTPIFETGCVPEKKSMVVWVEENPVVYNAYEDIGKKECLWREKSAESGEDVAVLKTR